MCDNESACGGFCLVYRHPYYNLKPVDLLGPLDAITWTLFASILVSTNLIFNAAQALLLNGSKFRATSFIFVRFSSASSLTGPYIYLYVSYMSKESNNYIRSCKQICSCIVIALS